MERVVTINLNGNPYQLEEPACDALRAYLARAQSVLADNPDKAEIVRDLEQAVADKCAGYLSPSKSVVSAAEMARILEEMGPVEGAEDGDGGAPRPEGGAYEAPRRRLYRVKNRAVIAGVCSGIGAYFDLDPNIIRLLFILGALFTSGFGILVYIVLMFAIPSAHTSEEWAAAHGVPFNAQEIIDRAKREYGKFTEESARSWSAENQRWRRHWREHSRDWYRNFTGWDNRFGGWDTPRASDPPAPSAGYVERMFAGLGAFVFSIVAAVLLIAFLLAFFSLLSTGAIFGWTPPGEVPTWMALLALCIAYGALSTPLIALRRSSYATLSGRRYHGGGDGLITLVIVAVLVWFAWAYWPEARMLMEEGYLVIRDLVTNWNEFW
jgi:phage shock protein PspC (stress-responsive transcriptional regulator)